MSAKISIIIPVLNEASKIAKTITVAKSGKNVEILVVDGGSQDNTVEIVQALGLKILFASPSRANQMNVGAKAATGEILLFLHADTHLPAKFDRSVRLVLCQPNTIAGAFALQIDGSLKGLRLVEKGVNWRSHFLSLPYGDQAIFVKTETFKALGGFSQLPIMEDFEFVLKLRNCGRIAIIPTPVITSSRRWQKLGVWQTTIMNQLAIAAYFLKIPPESIAKWYRRKS